MSQEKTRSDHVNNKIIIVFQIGAKKEEGEVVGLLSCGSKVTKY